MPPTTDKSLRFERQLRFQQQLNVNATSDVRAWLRVSDVVEHVALWLDDRYLGDSETPFQPRMLELPNGTTSAILSVEFVQLDDIRLPRIELVKTGPIRIGRHRVTCAEASNDRGSLDIHVELDTNTPTSAWVRTVITDEDDVIVVDDARRHSLALGKNRLRWSETLDEPQLWQKRDASGTTRPLYNVCTSVGVYGATDTSDTAESTTGFRTVARTRGALRINDNVQPLIFLSMDAPPWPAVDSHAIVRLTRVNPTDVYREADAQGIFICQRLPDSADHARQVVDLLANHPSIIAWSLPRKPRRTLRAGGDPVRRVADRVDGTRPILTE